MKSIDILNEIDKSHGLKNLVGKALLSWSILFHRDIYNEFDAFIKMGYSVTDAVRNTSDKLNISEKTVYKVKKIMES